MCTSAPGSYTSARPWTLENFGGGTVVYAQRAPSADAAPAYGEARQWLRGNSVMVIAVVLIAAQVWWKAVFLRHFYFRQDDFQWMDRALSARFSWSYLMTVDNGYLMPGGFALTWLLARASMYDWTLASAITLALLAASSLALLRLLRTLFGARPWILIPLLVYLFTPLTLPGLSLWASTVQWLPLQLTLSLATEAHVRHVRTGRPGPAIAAAAWVAAGMAFCDQGFLVPFLLFALTSAFLVPGSWPRAAAATLRRYFRTWLLYAALAGGYVALFLIQLAAGNQQPVKPGASAGILSFLSTALRVSVIPAALGGPWHWFSNGEYGYATQTRLLTQLSWVVAAVVILVSLWYRRHAFRAWVILAGWLAVADMLPVVIARVGISNASFLALNLHYFADSAAVLAICAGLAFFPVAGEPDAYRAARPPAVLRAGFACLLAGGILAGSLWSGREYLSGTSTAAESSYIATATQAVRHAPADAVIVSAPVPASLINSSLFGRASYTDEVVGPLAPDSSRPRWTTAPSGLIPNLMIFDRLGRLWPVMVAGPVSVRPPPRRGCWPVTSAGARIPVAGKLYNWPWTVHLWYSGPAATLEVQYGQGQHTVTVPAGTHDVYVPVTGGGSMVVVSSPAGISPGCVSKLTVGSLQPMAGSIPIPFSPVR